MKKSGFLVSVCVMVVALQVTPAVVGAATGPRCPPGSYLPPDTDTLLDACKPCSMCPVNEIIRQPCTESSDTQCGPFYEFEDFNSDMEEGEDSEEYGPAEEGGLLPPGGVTQDNEVDPGLQDTTAGSTTGQKATSVQADHGRERWRELCFALIGALVLVTLAAALYVIISHVVRARRRKNAASAHHHDAEVTIHFNPDGYPMTSSSAGRHHHHSNIKTTRNPLAHLETQLAHNQRRRFWERLFRPLGGVMSGENDYVIAVNNARHHQGAERRLLAASSSQDNGVPSTSAQILPGDLTPPHHARYLHLLAADDPPAPGAPGDLHPQEGAPMHVSTDSGIIAGIGAGEQPHFSQV